MKINKKKGKGVIEQVLESKKRSDNPNANFKLSLADYDCTQKYGCSFKHWQHVGLLSQTMEMFHGYCQRPLKQQIDGSKFTIYGDFPPDNITHFEYPKHVTPDANWARIHINGSACIIGHILEEGTFCLVFLDKTHKFWPTKHSRSKKDGGIN